MDHFCPSYFALLGPFEQAALAETAIPKHFMAVFKILSGKGICCLVGGDLARTLYGIPGTTTETELLTVPGKEDLKAILAALKSANFRPEDQKTAELVEMEEGKGLTSLFFKDDGGHRIRVLQITPVAFSEAFERSVIIQSTSWKLNLLSLKDMVRLRSVADDR